MLINKKNISLIFINFFWIFFIPHNIKILSFIVATSFSLIEYIFTGLFYNNRLNITKFKHTNCQTSYSQYYANLYYTPVLFYANNIYNNQTISIILFPFNVWICELIIGQYLLYVFNKRIWYYNDNYSYFNGFITLNYFIYWLYLGLLFNMFIYLFGFI